MSVSYFQLLLLILCVIAISIGQILFKLAGGSLSHISDFPNFVTGLANAYLLGAVIIYGATTIVWVWILRVVPLYLAYPVMALSFILVPVLSAIAVGEPLRLKSVMGGFLIIVGIYVIVR